MKVVVYQGQKKFTIDNISIPDTNQLKKLMEQKSKTFNSIDDMQLYNFRITSTRGALYDEWEEIEDEELEKEIEEGINWHQETVN
jgi:hypothetical protein